MVKMRINVALILSLFVITAAVYSRAVYFPFCVIDDNDYVTKNIHVTSGLSFDSVTWAFTSFDASNWHPVTWLSLMLDSQLFGLNPVGFHFVNIVLHALNTSLLFLLFRSTTGVIWRSAFVAACFALHPLHVESVAWIAERKDVLSTLFLILTLLFYSSYVKSSRRSMYFLSLATFILGLMAKPMLVTIPVVLLLLDFWPLERLKMGLFSHTTLLNNNNISQLKPLLLEKIPFVVLAACSSVVTLFAQKPSMYTLTEVSLFRRVTNALWALVMYVEKMFFPFDLSIFYPLVPVPLWKAGCAALLLSCITFVVLKYMNGFPYLAAGWFWYLVTLLPVLGIIQVGSQSMADRYTYIPLIGLFAMISWGGAELSTKVPKFRNIINVAAIGAVLFFAGTTWIQLSYWRNNISLMLRAIETTENNSVVHFTLGLMYDEQGRPDLAFDEYNEVVRIDPFYPDPQFHNNFGCALVERGMIDDAIKHFSFASQLNPDYKMAEINLHKTVQIKSKMSKE